MIDKIIYCPVEDPHYFIIFKKWYESSLKVYIDKNKVEYERLHYITGKTYLQDDVKNFKEKLELMSFDKRISYIKSLIVVNKFNI